MAHDLKSNYRVFVSNFVGCESTSSEGVRVINYLKLNGHTIVNEPKQAEYIIVNTCAFVEVQRRNMMKTLTELASSAPMAKLIIMGCARDIAPDCLDSYDTELLCGHYDLDQLDSIFATRIRFGEADRFSMHVRLQKTVIVACRGCVGNCTYCSIKRSTGQVKSQPIHVILEDVRKAMTQGHSDFLITGDDLGSYGLDIRTTLPSLLKEITEANLDIKVLLGNINPRWINAYIDDLVSFFQSEVAHKWIFIPIQSANNEVLRSMGRLYTIEDCTESIRKLQTIEGMKFYYDFIVGFPTETDSAFMDSANFVLQYPPSDLTVARYSREMGTPAYDLEPLPNEVLRARHHRLIMVYSAAQKFLSERDPSLVREFGT